MVLVGRNEQADEIDGVLGENVLVDGVDAAILDAEVGGAPQPRAAAPAEGREQRVERGQRLQLLHLERRADDGGEIADLLGHEEIVPHEALDAAQAAFAPIAEAFGHQLLHIEGEPLLRPLGEEVQLAANRPQKALAATEAPIFLRREHAGLDEFGLGLVGIEMLGEPVQRMQVAQAAFAVLDIRLDQIARGAGASVAGVLLGELSLDERPRVALEHLLAEAMLEIGVERLVAEDEPRVEQRGADGHVGVAQPHALVDGARRVADLEAEIPQQIEHIFGDALAPCRLLVGKQEEEIDVGARREQAAPIAALRHHCHPLGGRGIVGAIDVGGGEVVGELDEGVLEGREAFGAGPAVAILLELPLGRCVGLIDELAQPLDQSLAQRVVLPGISMGKPRGFLAQDIEVEIGGFCECRLVHGRRGVI